MKQIAKAILSVMNEVKGIDKTMTIGSGQMSYKGVSDQEVKKVVGQAMFKHGLTLLPISVEPKTQINDWEEHSQYGTKRKQSVFTEVVTKYMLLHESGESIEICGYGHGVDAQDKGAGKATTYALKYALLYTFLIPTGKIDDADAIHSNDIVILEKANVIKQKGSITNERFKKALKKIEDKEYTAEAMRITFELTSEQEEMLKDVNTEKDEQ